MCSICVTYTHLDLGLEASSGCETMTRRTVIVHLLEKNKDLRNELSESRMDFIRKFIIYGYINNISWMKDGVVEEETIRGNLYLVRLDESQGGGNYTCHSKDGSLLNHTVVLIQEDEELEEDSEDDVAKETWCSLKDAEELIELDWG